MRIRLIFRLGRPFSRHEQLQTDIFGRILPRPRRPLFPLFGSLVAHGALLALIPFAAELANTYSDDIDWSAYRVEPMRIRVPDVIYYTAPTRKLNPNASAGSKRRSSPEERTNREAAAQRRNAMLAISLPKGIELPPLEAGETESAILQPDAPKPRRPATLPPLAFWARTSGKPKPSRDQVTLPGRAEDAGSLPQLAAPPVLAVPNRELELSDRNIAAATPVPAPVLPAAPSATAPIRENTGDPRSGVVDRLTGQSANVISLSSAPIRPGEVINVLPGSAGLRSSHTNSAEGGAGTDTRQVNGSGDGQQTHDSAPGAAATRETAASRGNGSGGNGSAKEQTGSPQPSAASATTLSATAAGPSRAPAADGGAEAFKRIVHPPNGTFDVVVTQSAGASELQGLNLRLSGSPVYTVYLQVGDLKEWVLAFCLPPSPPLRNNPYEIFVEAPAPLSPPYPITTVVPQSIVGQPRPSPVAFRGFLTADGALRGLSASEPSSTAQQVAAVLNEWRFRPAKKNNTPAEVEVLIILPVIDANRVAFREKQRTERPNPASGL